MTRERRRRTGRWWLVIVPNDADRYSASDVELDEYEIVGLSERRLLRAWGYRELSPYGPVPVRPDQVPLLQPYTDRPIGALAVWCALWLVIGVALTILANRSG